MSEAKGSNVALKGARPQDPWLTLYGTPEEIAKQIQSVFPGLTYNGLPQFPDLVGRAQQLWAAGVTVGAELGGTTVGVDNPPRSQDSSPAPQANVPQGRGAAPACQHGERNWKEGISQKSGKKYAGWFCPVGSCDPVWPPR